MKQHILERRGTLNWAPLEGIHESKNMEQSWMNPLHFISLKQ